MKIPVLGHNPRHIPVTAEQVARYQPDLRPRPSFSRFVGEARVLEDWLEVPIGDGWIAAYRVVHGGRPDAPRTRILEVRVFPDEIDRATLGEWSAAVLGHRATTAHRFSFERLRRGVTEKAFNTALEATRAPLVNRRGALQYFGYPAARHHAEHEGRGAGRPGRQRTFYAKLAVRYDAIEQNPRREPRTSTRKLLQHRYYQDASLADIGKWLTTARRQGFLTTVARGARGSRATEAARTLAKRSKD
jgi:hypothetical protein